MRETSLETGEVDLSLALAPLAMLPGDPTVRLAPGRFVRSTLTPEGPGTIAVAWDPAEPRARVRTTGPGEEWLARRAAALLGLADDATGFAPDANPLRSIWSRFRGDRISASGTVWHDLAFFIVQQRVTRDSAAQSWRQLVSALGTPVPGSALPAPPEAAHLARLTYDALHRFGLERRRAEVLIAAARTMSRLSAATLADRARVEGALGAVRGIGPWTLSCLATATWGDADTVITGDSGIPSMVSWMLAREPRGDDARMLTLLEPYRPHRYRVIRLAFASGSRPPRQAPRVPDQPIRDR